VHYHLPRRFGSVHLIERVTLHEPERIEFELLHGPLDRIWEEISLEAISNDRTVVRYRGEAGHSLPIIGPLLVQRVAVPAYERYMRRTFAALKAAAEARAARSRRYARPGQERPTGVIGQSSG
ncbi:MAG: hypothetical protein M3406_16170, partial [Chloroflexota bacterium]|nr:hypothetical protein [Chloroflexota bacterium]